MTLAIDVETILEKLGTKVGGDLQSQSPIDGKQIGSVATSSSADLQNAVARSQSAFLAWRNVPAPRRGELVRLFGNALRVHKTTSPASSPLSAESHCPRAWAKCRR